MRLEEGGAHLSTSFVLLSFSHITTHVVPLLPSSSPEEAITIHNYLRLLHAPMALPISSVYGSNPRTSFPIMLAF